MAKKRERISGDLSLLYRKTRNCCKGPSASGSSLLCRFWRAYWAGRDDDVSRLGTVRANGVSGNFGEGCLCCVLLRAAVL